MKQTAITHRMPIIAAVSAGLLLLFPLPPRAVWQAANGPLKTRWAKGVSPANAHPEYPRPQMVRKDWMNLNGLWDFGVAGKDATRATFDTQILVPFPPESALSGVMRPVSEKDRLWYRRTFALPADWRGRRLLLHFGAVDYEATVWLNGQEVGRHRGGYDAFSFDVTDAVKRVGENEVILAAWDRRTPAHSRAASRSASPTASGTPRPAASGRRCGSSLSTPLT